MKIILVNDGSDDQCPQICDRHAQEDERVKVIYKESGWIDSARKAGVLASTGKYVGYVDGDDWIELEMYEKLLEYAQVYEVDVVESGVIDIGITEHRNRVTYLEEGCYKDRDFLENEGYSEFYSRFKGTKLCSCNDMQIKYYARYWLLFKAPYAFDEPDESISLTQFGGIKSGASIVLYGAGAAGIHLEYYIRSINKYNVVCWVDQNYETLRETMDEVSPNEIIDKEYDLYCYINIKANGS